MKNAWPFRLVVIGALVLSLGCDRLPTVFERLPFQEQPVRLAFETDPEVGLEASMLPGGPDLNGDELVNQLDLSLLSQALETREGLDPSMDVNRDGIFDESDRDWLRDVTENGRPGLASVDSLFDDGEAFEPLALEIEGFGFRPDLEVLIGTSTLKPDKLELRNPGPSTAWLFYESLEQAPEQGTLVSVRTGLGSSHPLPLDVLLDVIGDQDESTALTGTLFQQAPEGKALGAPETDCCIKWIKFRGVRSGVRIFAFDDGGNPADHNGPKLKTSKTTKLSCDARTVSIVVEEDGVPAASFTFDCETLKKAVFSEPMPPATGAGTVARPRELFEIVDFKTGPCESPGALLPEGLRGGVTPVTALTGPRQRPIGVRERW